MAGKAGTKANTRRKPRLPRYFFLKVPNDDGVPVVQLHRKLHIDRTNDIITAWSFSEGKRRAYTYSDVLKRYEPGFTTAEVCSMINRQRTNIEMAIINGHIPMPPFAYDLDTGKKTKYFFHEQDILEVHRHFAGIHRGRPRKDGLITPQAMPTRRELMALIRQNEVLYVKDGDTYVPTWRAADF